MDVLQDSSDSRHFREGVKLAYVVRPSGRHHPYSANCSQFDLGLMDLLLTFPIPLGDRFLFVSEFRF